MGPGQNPAVTSRAGPNAARRPGLHEADSGEQTPDKSGSLLTELVDHMPMSADPNVPSPLKFFGYIPGENDKLTYHKDIVRYLRALQQASPRVKLWTIGKTEEGRDMVAVAIADEATIKNLQHYKDITAQLTDPRKTSDALAKQLIATGKPIYYANGSIHTPEPGSPEMLMELAYRLAIEETPFIQDIRNNIIVVLTPASEVDGREKLVDQQRQAEAVEQDPDDAGQLRRPAVSGLLGALRPARQQPRRDRQGARAHEQHPEDVSGPARDGLPRSARIGGPALRLDRHGAL